jgi:hypothetical protein
MIVKCISTSSSADRPEALHFRWLTLDKIYNVAEIRILNSDWNCCKVSYYIIDDCGEISPYPKHCFMDLMLWRQQQIEKVLNDSVVNPLPPVLEGKKNVKWDDETYLE